MVLTFILPQNTLDNDLELEGRSVVAVARYHRRLQLLLRAIFAVSGQVKYSSLIGQSS